MAMRPYTFWEWLLRFLPYKKGEKYELHRLLSTLLSAELTVDEKLGIIRTEYSILVDDKLRSEERRVGKECAA